MKNFMNRLRWWLMTGKGCKHCCLICPYFDECYVDALELAEELIKMRRICDSLKRENVALRRKLAAARGENRKLKAALDERSES